MKLKNFVSFIYLVIQLLMSFIIELRGIPTSYKLANKNFEFATQSKHSSCQIIYHGKGTCSPRGPIKASFHID